MGDLERCKKDRTRVEDESLFFRMNYSVTSDEVDSFFLVFVQYLVK